MLQCTFQYKCAIPYHVSQGQLRIFPSAGYPAYLPQDARFSSALVRESDLCAPANALLRCYSSEGKRKAGRVRTTGPVVTPEPLKIRLLRWSLQRQGAPVELNWGSGDSQSRSRQNFKARQQRHLCSRELERCDHVLFWQKATIL